MKREEYVYGFPCVENPHDFTPDSESCTPEEIAFWEDAKKRWDAGERDVRGKRCLTSENGEGGYVHITQTSWGIGVNRVEFDEADECCDKHLPSAGIAQDGQRHSCPECHKEWEHVCDEAEGCWWEEVIA